MIWPIRGRFSKTPFQSSVLPAADLQAASVRDYPAGAGSAAIFRKLCSTCQKTGFFGRGFRVDVAVVVSVTLFARFQPNELRALSAVLFMMLGEFSGFGRAYYHSAVNYTTLGYGDVIMNPSWRLLGAPEAADGMLMFGISIAIIFAVIQRLVQTRFVELKN